MENCADADHKAVHVIRAFDLDRVSHCAALSAITLAHPHERRATGAADLCDQDGRISRDEWLTNLASFPQPTPDQLAEFRRQFGVSH